MAGIWRAGWALTRGALTNGALTKGALGLLAVLLAWQATPARANLELSLQDVTFADGTSVTGSFILNVYGYMSSVDIVTSDGTAAGGQAMPGHTYTNARVGADVTGAPAPTTINFYSDTEAFSLVLEFSAPLDALLQGEDGLVAGSGSGISLAGSFEACQNSCSDFGYLNGRLVTAGSLYVPEPASLTLLASGSIALPLMRRRARRNAGTAAARGPHRD